MIRLGLFAFGRKIAILITLYLACIPSTWPTTVDVEHDHLTEVLFVRFPHGKITLFPPKHLFLFILMQHILYTINWAHFKVYRLTWIDESQ